MNSLPSSPVIPGPTLNPDAPGFHFVLGMHRSGTSAVAGLLEGMGLSVGKASMPAAPENPRGFFENSALADFHDRLLEALGSTWHDPRPLAKRIRSLDAAGLEAWRRNLAEVLAEQFSPGAPCLVKDPRLCRLLPLWEPILADSAAPMVVVFRHPAAVAASLTARNGFSMGKALMLWLVNNLEMERESRAFRREFVYYPELLRDPGSVSERLRQRLGLPECDMTRLIRERLHAGLCHQDETWPEDTAGLREMCLTVFEILRQPDPAFPVLDSIFHEYEDRVGWLPDDFSGLGEIKLHREVAKRSPARRLHVQIFADRGTGYSESDSALCEVICNESQTIRIEHLERLRPSPGTRLRLDPLNARGIISLSSIRIFRESDHGIVYLAETEEEFQKIAFANGLMPCFDNQGLVLLAMDPDPQMLLPAIEAFPETPCTLEMRLHVSLSDASTVQQFNELRSPLRENERIRRELGRLQEEARRDSARIEALQAIVDSAMRWQRRSWFKRAFHRWRPPV